ncbi:VHS domain-containing protein/GAT domain-containing protein [Cephalotus follicularis]|uniref:VHS domain-containing protein/GAT domain-containing protein n=1 Tax=Cephalotus follicularis TaxID=3775 RepID=A0A1Q3CKY3_CEPFO|nr:VHS domain-containing protein/GAT domain-containing protein [Cephalotus follicularis]
MASSSTSATVAVDKATSDLLIGPDWTMNIDICDSVNSNHWQAKDVVKAVKKRLQHKNSKVQLLALTLLETMVKNCGDFVHFQIAERNILGEMVKIVKKKSDMQVRDKILVLLDSWQEAFGGPGGKHPQYYWAYEDLRRSGVEFPKRSLDAAPIFTPPVTHPTLRHNQAGYGMPGNSSRRLDETMATEIETLSLSSLDAMRDVAELLGDMLQAVNTDDRAAVRDEVIVELVNRCRSNQKKLMQMLTSTGDEVLLARGLELNDILQSLLAKHDAIASGSILPPQVTNLSPKPTEVSAHSVKPTEVRDPRSPPAPVATVMKGQIVEEEEEEDDFAQLARRHSRAQSVPSLSTSTGTTGALVPLSNSNATPTMPITLSTSNALALPDPPAPVRTSKEQDMIDLLSLTLSTTSTSPHTPHTPSTSEQTMHQVPVSSTQGYPYSSQTYPGNQGPAAYNSYVVPWAQPQPQPQYQQQHFQPQPQVQPHLQSQNQPQLQYQYPQYSYGYPPPPWAAAPGYFNNQNNPSTTNNMFSTPRASTNASYTPFQAARPLQHSNSFPARVANGMIVPGDPQVSSAPRIPPPASAQKPFIPSYRLFEDLNVLGNVDGRFKVASSTSPTLSGTSGQGMVGRSK